MMPQPNNTNLNLSQLDYDALKQKQDDFNRFMQEMESTISRVDLYLNNSIVVKTDEREEVKQLGDPLLNERGREFVKTKLRLTLNHNTYMSAIEDKDIYRIYIVNIRSFRDDLYPCLELFNTSVENISKVFHIYCEVLYFALKKARGDKDAIYGTMKSQNTMPQPQGLSALLPNPFQAR